MKLTEMEESLLKAVATNDYAAGNPDGGGWTWAVIDESGIAPRQARGVLSSLIQKGLLTEETFDRPRDEYSVYSTEAGRIEIKRLLSEALHRANRVGLV